jgi:hypothetical protein
MVFGVLFPETFFHRREKKASEGSLLEISQKESYGG